jgi:hypothetical protein
MSNVARYGTYCWASPAGTIFLNSVDSSRQVNNAQLTEDVTTAAIDKFGPQAGCSGHHRQRS